jgi:hypothetical protein
VKDHYTLKEAAELREAIHADELLQVKRLLSEVMAQVDAAQRAPGRVGFVVSAELQRWWTKQKARELEE